MDESELTSQVVARAALPAETTVAMFAIFKTYYEQAELEIFERDLSNKNWVLLLHDRGGTLRGFTTLALYETEFGGRRVSVVYSGDTIIQPEFWGSPELARGWITNVVKLSAEMAHPLYWLLISSGYKTYRFLPIFFKVYYPSCEQPTPPDVQALIDHLARGRFGAEYDAERGIVRFARGATPLRPGVAEISAERLKDRHIAFFIERNPGHAQGDELVCLTEITPENYSAIGRRLLRGA
jgi:hypothetical protein